MEACNLVLLIVGIRMCRNGTQLKCAVGNTYVLLPLMNDNRQGQITE